MNDQDNRNDDIQTESLPDLPLAGEQAEDAKAGTGSHARGGGGGAGKVSWSDF